MKPSREENKNKTKQNEEKVVLKGKLTHKNEREVHWGTGDIKAK